MNLKHMSHVWRGGCFALEANIRVLALYIVPEGLGVLRGVLPKRRARTVVFACLCRKPIFNVVPRAVGVIWTVGWVHCVRTVFCGVLSR